MRTSRDSSQIRNLLFISHREHMTTNKSTCWQALEKHFQAHFPRQAEFSGENFLLLFASVVFVMESSKHSRHDVDSPERWSHALTAPTLDHNSPMVLLFINTFARHLCQTPRPATFGMEFQALSRQLYKFLIFRSYCVIHMEISEARPFIQFNNSYIGCRFNMREGRILKFPFIHAKCQLCANVKTISLLSHRVSSIERLSPGTSFKAHFSR